MNYKRMEHLYLVGIVLVGVHFRALLLDFNKLFVKDVTVIEVNKIKYYPSNRVVFISMLNCIKCYDISTRKGDRTE